MESYQFEKSVFRWAMIAAILGASAAFFVFGISWKSLIVFAVLAPIGWWSRQWLSAREEFEVAIHYLLNDTKDLIPLVFRKSEDILFQLTKDIAGGANPYAEAASLLEIILKEQLETANTDRRNEIRDSILSKNYETPSNFLRIICQIYYLLMIMKDKTKPPEQQLWLGWVNDMAKLLSDALDINEDLCIIYVVEMGDVCLEDKKKSFAHLLHPEMHEIENPQQ